MNVPSALVRLYPLAFRERWGPELESEVRTAGWRSWPNVVAGLVDLWLHPQIWPATSSPQRRHRIAALAVTVTAVAWFLEHATTETDSGFYHRASHYPVLDAGLLLLIAGLVLVAPQPRCTRRTLRMLLLRAATSLSLPAALGMAVVVAANGGVHVVEGSPLRPVLLAAWWSALGLGALGACRFFAALDPALTRPAHARRLRAGLASLAVAVGLVGATFLRYAATGSGIDVLPALGGCCFVALATVLVGPLRDFEK